MALGQSRTPRSTSPSRTAHARQEVVPDVTRSVVQKSYCQASFNVPYVGLGLGRVRFDHSNTFAAQVMAGVDYELMAAPVTIGAELRHFKTNGKTGQKAAPSKYHTNVIMLKARYAF